MEQLKIARVFTFFFQVCLFFFPASVIMVGSVWPALPVTVCVRACVHMRVTHQLLTGADDLSSGKGVIKRVRRTGVNE